MVEVPSDTNCQLAPQQGGMSCAEVRLEARLVPPESGVPMLSPQECAARQAVYVQGRTAWKVEVAALYGDAG
jgi:hypothetical protein